MYTKELAGNKKAYHDYIIEEKIECGIVLHGTEVKSAKTNGASIKEAYVRVINKEVYVIGMNIKPYEFGSYNNVEPLRDRKLLLRKREINKLAEKVKLDGMTLVPLRLYIKGGLVKIEIGLAKGKNKSDKRQALAKKDAQRRIERECRK